MTDRINQLLILNKFLAQIMQIYLTYDEWK